MTPESPLNSVATGVPLNSGRVRAQWRSGARGGGISIEARPRLAEACRHEPGGYGMGTWYWVLIIALVILVGVLLFLRSKQQR
jgi:hypothetical protein